MPRRVRLSDWSDCAYKLSALDPCFSGYFRDSYGECDANKNWSVVLRNLNGKGRQPLFVMNFYLLARINYFPH